jgi:hypothetical protein
MIVDKIFFQDELNALPAYSRLGNMTSGPKKPMQNIVIAIISVIAGVITLGFIIKRYGSDCIP